MRLNENTVAIKIWKFWDTRIFFFFYLSFTAFLDYSHLFWAKSIARWGKNGRSLQKTPDHLQAELGLSHTVTRARLEPTTVTWRGFRALKISSLNHLAAGAAHRKNCSCNYHKIWTVAFYLILALKRCRWNGKLCRPWSDCSWRNSVIWVYTDSQPCLSEYLRALL